MVDKQPVDNAINAITSANDLSADATIDGDHLVIQNSNFTALVDDSKPDEVRVPIVNGMVSQKAVERALIEMGSYYYTREKDDYKIAGSYDFLMAKGQFRWDADKAMKWLGLAMLVSVGLTLGWLDPFGCHSRPYRTMTVEEERRTQETWDDLMNPEPPPTVHVIIEDKRP